MDRYTPRLSEASEYRISEEGTHRKAKASIDTLYEISQILGTGIDKKTLTLCISLCEMGIPPENVAAVVDYLQRKKIDSLEI